jgi:N-acetylmuramoyl-L-alanine amidase-like protein
MTFIAISAGHGKFVRGASSDMMDEVDEARKQVSRLESELKARGVDVRIYWDDVSKTQDENLRRIVDWHNSLGPHDLDISCHFNAFEQTSSPRGCEVLYLTQKTLAAKLSAAIAEAGSFIDRGAKYNDDLYVLRHTIAPCVLLETCFVDSTVDCELYYANFDLICESIADVLGGEEEIKPEPAPPAALFTATGSCSHFGGPDDQGVDEDEGLAFIYEIEDAPHLFLPETDETEGLGLARRLNARAVNYIACRWNYDVTPKEMLAGPDVALVTATRTGRSAKAFPADWGPHEEKTGRAADLSPCLMDALGLVTDDEVTVTYPYREDAII